MVDKTSKVFCQFKVSPKEYSVMSRVRIKLFFFEEEKRVCTLASKFACVIAPNVET